jgi:hypothetical protein
MTMALKPYGVLSVLLVISISVVSATALIQMSWPNWTAADRYADAVGDAGSAAEDMTSCFITHNATYLFFRVEYSGAGQRNLIIYLDVDQDALTGDTGLEDTYGFDLHDLGADYRINVGLDPGVYEYSIWRPILAPYYYSVADTYVMVAVDLASLGNPSFPLDVLFVSSELIATDYAPSMSHLTYPGSVGGEITPLTAIQVLTPYVLALLLILGPLYALRKKRQF